MYPSDLSDEEWALLAPFFQRQDPRGNPGKYANRAIVNAILHVPHGIDQDFSANIYLSDGLVLFATTDGNKEVCRHSHQLFRCST